MTRSLRDNIFFNARANSGNTGKNYASKSRAVAKPDRLDQQQQPCISPTDGATFGFFNSLGVANIGDWQHRRARMAGSFESRSAIHRPDQRNGRPDLHIHPNPTVAEGNGVDVRRDGRFRWPDALGLTPPDIGADAGTFHGGRSRRTRSLPTRRSAIPR
ncbi:MAG: hypothetical protein IPO95_14360 [Rhodanobacteraceae bacterium]|nr:hypothetical protein [Rhodanobacteraceae bacterium]